MDKYLKRLCKAILAGKFNDENYRQRGSWHGHEIQARPLFCSYGTIGFIVTVFDKSGKFYCDVQWDWEMREITIADKPYKYYINLLYLEDNDISLSSEGLWDDMPNSVELETYTDAGEDMIIDLEEPTKEQLQKYINDFDVNENVIMWWRDGKDSANENGVPFDNIRDHYEDYDAFIETLQAVCDKMPY